MQNAYEIRNSMNTSEVTENSFAFSSPLKEHYRLCKSSSHFAQVTKSNAFVSFFGMWNCIIILTSLLEKIKIDQVNVLC